jgi:hypothetical protein
MTRSTLAIAATLALAVTLPAAPANAQTAIRTYVSTTGSDSNPCSLTAPCRHFQAAANATAAGGEVDALDPGGYGSFTISQAITIEGQGWSYVAPADNGIAIYISAGSGNVTIHGVSLNGVGTTDTNGIGLTATGAVALNIIDCVVDGFPGSGIFILPSSGQTYNILIANSFVLNNGTNGILIDPQNQSRINYAIERTTVANNGTSGLNAGILINSNEGFSNGTLTSVDADGNYIGVNFTGNGFGATAIIRNSILQNSPSNSDLSDTSDGEAVFLFDSNYIGTLNNGERITSDGTNDIINPLGNPLVSFSRQ